MPSQRQRQLNIGERTPDRSRQGYFHARERKELSVATPNERLLLTVPEMCELCHIKKTLGWKLVQTGEIPSIKLGRLVRVPRAELEAWIARQAAGEDPAPTKLRAIG
jgi:excisionase family DNA binding protein